MSRTISVKTAVAVAFVLGLFMDILDTTIVNVALPSIQRDFGSELSTTEWLVTGYLLSLAVFIPASGWLGDRYGTKRIFVLALSIFTAASVLCALSPTIEWLIAFRVLQGVGGGMLTPVGTAMLFRVYPPAERARASSILASVTVLAPALGPVLGGFLTEYASWHWIFVVNLPIGLVGIWFTMKYVPEHTEPNSGRFDIPGVVLSGAGLALILYALSQGPLHGWTSTVVLASAALGSLSLALLVVVELHTPKPMLDLRLLVARSFRTPNVVSFFATAALIGLLFLLPQFLQGPRGLSPFQSGLTTFPQAFGVIIMARIVGAKLYPIFGPRRLAMFGLGMNALITSMFLFVDLDTSQWIIRTIMFTRGLSIGFVFIPIQTAAFAQVTTQQTGRASSLFQAQRQIGSAFGVAILATVLAERLKLVGGPAAQAVEQVSAYHEAMFFAVLIAVVGFVAAMFIHDSDAAGTMVRQPRGAVRAAASAEVH